MVYIEHTTFQNKGGFLFPFWHIQPSGCLNLRFNPAGYQRQLSRLPSPHGGSFPVPPSSPEKLCCGISFSIMIIYLFIYYFSSIFFCWATCPPSTLPNSLSCIYWKGGGGGFCRSVSTGHFHPKWRLRREKNNAGRDRHLKLWALVMSTHFP